MPRRSSSVGRSTDFGSSSNRSFLSPAVAAQFMNGTATRPAAGDRRLLQLAGREPLVLLGELGRQLGDRLAVLGRQLRAADERRSAVAVELGSAASDAGGPSPPGVSGFSAIALSRDAIVPAMTSRRSGR